ncbi:hypothetical protein [Streptomyces sp. JJ36]|uniref:DUF6895 family protein n=1 Tax=Streptomyces sp. JJ36 TaxID=2736645 RepID=UPI001F1C59EE|nr:hypothetical protein [Streptomyces sp. JJ36]
MTAPAGPRAAAPARLVHGVGAGALEWLDAHREFFRARRDDTTPDTEVKDRFKPLGELATIGAVLFREGVAGSRQARIARRLLDFAWHDLLDSGALLAWMQREEPLSPIPLEIYVPFREVGYVHPGIERAAAVARGLASWPALGMLPVRRLGLAATERRAGLPPSTGTEEALRGTWLGRAPEPWTVEQHLAYDVTHTVYHLTDWGADPGGLPAGLAGYLTHWLPAWLDDWAGMEHWDLVGELLVVDACLPVPALDREVWERFAAARSPDGAMPVQHGMPEGDTDEVFDLVYHPTLVAALASALATSRALSALTGADGGPEPGGPGSGEAGPGGPGSPGAFPGPGGAP